MIRLPGHARWIALEFKLADMWIGAFWDIRKADYGTGRGLVSEELHVWICLVPCFPVHYVAAWRYRKEWGK